MTSGYPINPAAEETFHQHLRNYYRTLLSRADILARQRNGNSIESGDFDDAVAHIESRGRKAQSLLAAGSAAAGAGLSGLVQNALDGKPVTYLLAFAFVLGLGIWAAKNATSGR